VSLYRAFAESFASENVSRLASIQIAAWNVKKDLLGRFAAARQTGHITVPPELLDTIAAFEAMRGTGRRF